MASWLCSLLREGMAVPADKRSEGPLRAWREYCVRGGASASEVHASAESEPTV